MSQISPTPPSSSTRRSRRGLNNGASNSSSDGSLLRTCGSGRVVTQLVFSRWPEQGLPEGGDFLNFVKASFSCRMQAAAGANAAAEVKTCVQSR